MNKSELKSEIKKILNENFGLSGISYPSVLNSPLQKFSERHNLKPQISLQLKENISKIIKSINKSEITLNEVEKISYKLYKKYKEDSKNIINEFKDQLTKNGYSYKVTKYVLTESSNVLLDDLKNIKTAFGFLTKNSNGWLDKQNENTKRSFFRLHNLLGLGD